MLEKEERERERYVCADTNKTTTANKKKGGRREMNAGMRLRSGAVVRGDGAGAVVNDYYDDNDAAAVNGAEVHDTVVDTEMAGGSRLCNWCALLSVVALIVVLGTSMMGSNSSRVQEALAWGGVPTRC